VTGKDNSRSDSATTDDIASVDCTTHGCTATWGRRF
jgi:hypothetical protein